jgi:hypothetical protein
VVKELFRPNMTAEEQKEALRIHDRIWAVTVSKLQYIPDEHAAEIRAVYVEEGLMDLDEAGYSCQTILARRMAEKFYDIPIAVTVFEGKTYGAYIGNWAPYEIPAYQPMIATLAIQMGLFNDQTPGDIAGKPVVWWRNKRA